VRAAIERRIMQMVASPPPPVERRERLRVRCELSVKLVTKEKSIRASTRDIGAGGVFIDTAHLLEVGAPVTLELRSSAADEHGLRVHGRVAWVAAGGEDGRGLGIAFSHLDNDAHERRVRRFVIAALRHRVQ
jgi:uncharacterized protein (TIGR02266 family)